MAVAPRPVGPGAGQGGLSSYNAVGGGLHLATLGFRGMRRVVGRDDVDGAVGQPLAYRLDVLVAAQRRVHPL